MQNPGIHEKYLAKMQNMLKFYQGTQTYKKQKNFEKIKEHKETTINKNLRMTISSWLFNQESRK